MPISRNRLLKKANKKNLNYSVLHVPTTYNYNLGRLMPLFLQCVIICVVNKYCLSHYKHNILYLYTKMTLGVLL